MKVFIPLFLLLPMSLFAYQAEVIKVQDGDSLLVRYAGEELRVRLYGIDAPENNQAFGPEAREALKDKLQGESVDIRPQGKDQYERILGLVYLGGENINRWLVSTGYAWVYTGYCKKDYCIEWYQLEKKAREGGRGLWRDPDAQAPWLFRKEQSRPPKKEIEKGDDNPVLAFIIILLLALGALPLLRKGLLKNYIKRRTRKHRD